MRFLKGLAASLSLIVASAFVAVQAAVPLVASGAVTDLVTDTGTFIDSLWGIVAIVVVGFIWMKLFKKGASKAT